MRCPWAVEGRSSFAISSPSRVGKGRGDGPPWQCTAERVNRCGGNNPQSWLAPLTAPQFAKAARIRSILSPLRGRLLCQRSLLVSALSNAIRIRNPLEFTTLKRPLSERGRHGVIAVFQQRASTAGGSSLWPRLKPEQSNSLSRLRRQLPLRRSLSSRRTGLRIHAKMRACAGQGPASERLRGARERMPRLLHGHAPNPRWQSMRPSARQARTDWMDPARQARAPARAFCFFF